MLLLFAYLNAIPLFGQGETSFGEDFNKAGQFFLRLLWPPPRCIAESSNFAIYTPLQCGLWNVPSPCCKANIRCPPSLNYLLVLINGTLHSVLVPLVVLTSFSLLCLSGLLSAAHSVKKDLCGYVSRPINLLITV